MQTLYAMLNGPAAWAKDGSAVSTCALDIACKVGARPVVLGCAGFCPKGVPTQRRGHALAQVVGLAQGSRRS